MRLDFTRWPLAHLPPMRWRERLSIQWAILRIRRTREQFYEDLSEAIADKESINQFIRIRRARAIQQKDPLSCLYPVMLNRLSQRGGSLARMLHGIVPDTDLMIITSIENQGHVDQGLKFLAATVTSQRTMIDAMRSALIAPALIAMMCLFFTVILAVFVIPVFADIVPPARWDTLGRSMHGVSYIVTHCGLFILMGLLGAIGGLIWSIPHWSRPKRAKVDRYVPYRVFRDYTGAVVLAALASLLMSGETLVGSLEKLKARSSPWLRWHCSKMIDRLSTRAQNDGEAFNTGLFGQELANRLVDYSRRSGNFSEVVKRLGIQGIEAAKKRVQRSARRLNLALIFVLGGVMAYLLTATLLTAQGLSEKLRQENMHSTSAKKWVTRLNTTRLLLLSARSCRKRISAHCMHSHKPIRLIGSVRMRGIMKRCGWISCIPQPGSKAIRMTGLTPTIYFASASPRAASDIRMP